MVAGLSRDRLRPLLLLPQADGDPERVEAPVLLGDHQPWHGQHREILKCEYQLRGKREKHFLALIGKANFSLLLILLGHDFEVKRPENIV